MTCAVLERGLSCANKLEENSRHGTEGDWGETTQVFGSTSQYNPYRYTGQQFDSETGLYYLRARSYAPGLGRFTSRDPIAYDGGLNLYGYCGGDPINFNDPEGLKFANPNDFAFLKASNVGIKLYNALNESTTEFSVSYANQDSNAQTGPPGGGTIGGQITTYLHPDYDPNNPNSHATAADKRYAQYYTLAHELIHAYILDKYYRGEKFSLKTTSADQEYLAEQFANAFYTSIGGNQQRLARFEGGTNSGGRTSLVTYYNDFRHKSPAEIKNDLVKRYKEHGKNLGRTDASFNCPGGNPISSIFSP